MAHVIKAQQVHLHVCPQQPCGAWVARQLGQQLPDRLGFARPWVLAVVSALCEAMP
jgi:hypothetical protein